MRADFHLHFLSVDFNCLVLKVWLPNLLRVALLKADIIAILLAFAGEFTFLHDFSPDSRCYCTDVIFKSQLWQQMRQSRP